MLRAVPKHTELFKKLKEFAEAEQHDEFTLKRLKHEAESLLKVDTASAYMAFGILANVGHDSDSVHTNFQKALSLSPYNANIIANYSASLGFLGFFSEAADLILKAYNLAPDDLAILENAVVYNRLAGRFHQASELISAWEKMNSGKSHQHGIINTIGFLDERHVKDADLEKLVHVTVTILHEHKIYIRPQHVNDFLSEDEDGRYFEYWVALKEPVDRVIELNSELSERMIDECPDVILTGDFVALYEAVEAERDD